MAGDEKKTPEPGRFQIVLGAVVLLLGLGFLAYLILTDVVQSESQRRLVAVFVALVVAIGAAFLGGGATVNWTTRDRVTLSFVGGVAVFVGVLIVLFRLYVPDPPVERAIEMVGYPAFTRHQVTFSYETDGLRGSDVVKGCLGGADKVLRCVPLHGSPVLLAVLDGEQWLKLIVEDAEGTTRAESERYDVPVEARENDQ